MSDAIRHVRRAGKMRTDRRFRMGGMRMIANQHPTVCGAAPTERDIDRAGLRHLVEQFAVVRPDWLADVCPACRASVEHR